MPDYEDKKMNYEEVDDTEELEDEENEESYNEEDYDPEQIALAHFLNCHPDELTEENDDYYGMKSYSYGERNEEKHIWPEEYLVGDYNSSYDAAVESTKNLLDDIGLEGLNNQEYFIDKYFDEYTFDEMVREDAANYVYDIKEERDEDYENRFYAECIEYKFITEDEFAEGEYDEDDLTDKFIDWYVGEYSTPSEYFENMYGRNWAREIRDWAKDYINYDGIAEEIVDMDGMANELASYDGDENDEEVNGETYYIYRTN